ncbi:MAG: AAA family ATPase, partial [Cytophagales bacterium]|nr:AAA family ATPase [Cytophagales bacterium]
MYTELVKIIEAGMLNDNKKVFLYSRHIAEKLRKDGNERLATRILNVLKGKSGNMVYKDELFSSPVDGDSRMNIADILMPDQINFNGKVSESKTKMIHDFKCLVENRDKLEDLGVDINTSLLLYGPPGCGKTTFAKLIAKELDVPLIIARFDSLVSSLFTVIVAVLTPFWVGAKVI